MKELIFCLKIIDFYLGTGMLNLELQAFSIIPSANIPFASIKYFFDYWAMSIGKISKKLEKCGK